MKLQTIWDKVIAPFTHFARPRSAALISLALVFAILAATGILAPIWALAGLVGIALIGISFAAASTMRMAGSRFLWTFVLSTILAVVIGVTLHALMLAGIVAVVVSLLAISAYAALSERTAFVKFRDLVVTGLQTVVVSDWRVRVFGWQRLCRTISTLSPFTTTSVVIDTIGTTTRRQRWRGHTAHAPP